MAEDKNGTLKPEKTTEKREIIGTVKGIADDGKTMKIKFLESDGSDWEWKTFHASEWRGKVEVDKTYRIEVALIHEQGRNYPWRNLVQLIGVAEMPASGEMTSRPGAKSSGGASPPGAVGGGLAGRSWEQSILTRNSIEAGNAANMVIELMKMGVTPDDMSSALEDLFANADKVVDWMSSHWVELQPNTTPAASNNGASKAAAKKGNGPKAVEKPAHIGEFLNTCLAKWQMDKSAVEEALGEPVTPDMDFEEALQRVGYIKTEPQEAGAAA